MVERALVGNANGLAKLLADADEQATQVKKILPADAAKQFDSFLQAIHQAADARNHMAVAQNSLVIFRLLIDNLTRCAQSAQTLRQ
jgi:hypothetical protein